MKIIGCAVSAVSVNFEGVMPGTHVVLRLRTDQGLEGIAYVSRLNPATIRPMCLLIDALVDTLIGQDPTDIEAIHAKIFKGMLGAPLVGMERRAATTSGAGPGISPQLAEIGTRVRWPPINLWTGTPSALKH